MTFIKDNAGWVALVILALMFGMGLLHNVTTNGDQVVGSTACSSITCISGGLRLVADAGGDFESDVAALFSSTLSLGTNGTTLSQLQKGTCSVIGATSGIVASTSIALDCAVTGVVTGDTVFAQFATSTPSATGMGWLITRASASTTSGFITLSVTNGTGGTANLSASLGSSTKYLILR